jgi:curved DNA-binding protein
MTYKDYYKIMGLTKQASDKDIKIAYRRLARKYHPDISKEKNAEEKFKELGEAYEVLKDPEKRKTYDHYGQDRVAQKNSNYGAYQNQAHAQGESFNYDADFFESLFGKGFKPSAQKGLDLKSSVSISLEESVKGGVRELTLSSGIGNSPQTLRVKIPAGIRTGQQIRLAGQGAPGNGAAAGDLYLTVHVEKHPLFDVEGDDIYLTLPISPWEAALGATVNVPTLNGKVGLKIPAGSQGGQTLRLRNKGIPGKKTGDQLVILKIIIPQPKSDEQKLLYEKMAEIMPFNPRESLRA